MKLSTIISGAALGLSMIVPVSAFSPVTGWPPAGTSIDGYQFTSSAAFTSDGKILIGGFIQGGSHALFALTTAGAVSWTRELSDGGILSALGQECSPTIGRDGTIYIGSWDQGLYALNPSNGQKKGSVYFQPSTSRKGPLRTSVSIDRQNRIYVFYDQDPNASQPTAHLTCLQLNSDGTIPTTPLWEWPPAGQTILGNAISSPAVDGNGRVYIATREIDTTRRGWVFAIDGSSGSPVLKWQFPSTTPGPDDPDCIGSVVASPVIGADGTVYIGTQSGFEPGSVHSPTIFALDPDVVTGDRVKWSFPPSAGGHQELVGAFDASPAISSDGIIYAVSDADARDPNNKIPPMVYAIDSLTGAELWRFSFNRVPADNGKTGDNAPVIAANGDIFVKAIGVNTFGSLVRLNSLDGTILDETQIFGDFDTFHAQFDMPFSQLAVNSSGQVFVATTSATDSTANPPVGLKLFDSGITGDSFWPKWRANNFSTGSVQDNKWTTNTTIGVSITTLLPSSSSAVAQAYAVNNLGKAVGYHSYTTPTNIYYLPCNWNTTANVNGNNPTDMQQVHPLDYPNNMFGINDANQCVGVENYLGGPTRGIIYSSLTATPQLLGLPSGFSSSSDAYGICKGGPAGRASLAVGDAVDSSGIHHAVQWSVGSPTDAGTDLGSLSLGGGAHSYAYAVNSRNWIVGYSQVVPGGGYRAFASPNPSQIDTAHDNIGGTDSSIATAINGAGQVVGGSYNGATGEHAYLWRMKLANGFWTVAAKVDLGAISGGTGRATAINNRGQVVGFYTVSGVSKAFIWLPGWSTIRDLRNFLSGSDFTTWTVLTAATGISDDGCVIGYGQKSGSTGLVPFAIRVKP